VVNEFGDVGLDHLLMEKAGEGVVLLASGCLCCSMRGELLDTLLDLASRRETGALPPFARVIIETTGLADPAPVLQTLLAPMVAAAGYRLAGVVTLVDALLGDATLDEHAVSVAQVAVADQLLLAKEDLVSDPARLAALRERLAALNPAARLGSAAEASSTALFAADARPVPALPAGATGRTGLSQLALGRGQSRPGFTCHDASISSFALTTATAMTAEAMEGFFALLQERHGASLLRVKALIKLAHDPERPVVVQGVQHVLHPVARLKAWPDGEAFSRLVFIGRDLDAAGIADLFAAFSDEPRLDAPDRAALTGNPLTW